MPKVFAIFPPIGIARLGQDDDFFLGPEIPGRGPVELNGAPVTRFKKTGDPKQIRKQGARFRLFESDDGRNWRPAALPPGARVAWRVALANKKAAIDRAGPPATPTPPVVQAANRTLVIDAGAANVSGPSAASAPLVGDFNAVGPGGAPYHVRVELGRLRTDADGNLIVLGGKGFSSAPPGVALGASFYHNPNWHDDVADGPVSAEIQTPGQPAVKVDRGAWVSVAPPDFAPGIDGLVTLYDVLRQIGTDKGALPAPQPPSFDRDVAPLIARARRLQWVHDNANWSDSSLLDPELRSRAASARPKRELAKGTIKAVEAGPILENFHLREFQKTLLDAWAQGDFDDAPEPPEKGVTAAGLTRAALEATVGQGFFPGIEAGIRLTDASLYADPFDFRLDATKLEPGDLTAQMAQPWQADFFDCAGDWWPSQRPDIAFQDANAAQEWTRGIADMTALKDNFARLGFVVRQGDAEVFLEQERDGSLDGPGVG